MVSIHKCTVFKLCPNVWISYCPRCGWENYKTWKKALKKANKHYELNKP